MAKNFYSRPTSTIPFDSIQPRELLPLAEPPFSLLLYPPGLPCGAEERRKLPCPVSDDFASSVHIIPAAYPRIAPFVPVPASNVEIHGDNLSGEERKAKVKATTEAILLIKSKQVQGEYPPEQHEQRILWNTVTRYYRDKLRSGTRSKSITLLFAHANGFPKETWEPFLGHLIAGIEHSGNGSVSIDEIWSFEAVNHGDAALINEDKIGALYDWADHSRDILNFLTRYLPTRRDAGESLPVHLPRLPIEVEKSRILEGLSGDRTLVGIGHSLGGATTTLAAISNPRLFSHIVLVDPVIVAPYIDRSKGIYNMTLGAIRRRHVWDSREEARRLLGSSPFFAAWDPEVLDNYIEYGLTPSSAASHNVKLKMPGIQEAAVFAESRASQEIFERLKDLDPSVSLHWVMAGKNSIIPDGSQETHHLVWRRPSNASNTKIASSGHLIVQEAPMELAREVQTFLERSFVEDRRAKL